MHINDARVVAGLERPGAYAKPALAAAMQGVR
jgi:hypothetical protein